MIKSAYGINAKLAAALPRNSADVSLGSAIVAKLNIVLSPDDWCYLSIDESNKHEVIKILNHGAWLEVFRGINGAQYGFSPNANIGYKLTSNEVIDRSNNLGLTILSADSGVNINNGVVSYNFNLVGMGGVDIIDNVIVDNYGMFGCCGDNSLGAPDPGGEYFYFTSQLYAQLVVDAVTPTPKNNMVMPPYDPNNPESGWWLLTQPYMTGDTVANSIGLNDWNLYGGAKATAAQVEGYISQSISTMDWNLFGGAKEYSYGSEYINMNSYVLQMQLFGGAIVYDRAMDAYISPDIKLLDWSLV